MNSEKIEEYISSLSENLKRHLQKGVSLDIEFYPAMTGGVVEVLLGPDRKNSVNTRAMSATVNEILKNIPQRMVAGNIDAVQFGGTNISLENNRILFIKGGDAKWGKKEAAEDVSRVIGAERRSI